MQAVKLLVVEDEQDWRDIIATSARILGYTVVTASNFTELQAALSKAEASDDPFTAATIDFMFNVSGGQKESLQGKQILRYIRTNYPNIACITITGARDITPDQILDMRDEYDLDYYIYKPTLDADSLQRAVEKALSRRAASTETSRFASGKAPLVFISYQRKSSWAHARALANSLRANGLNVFLDVDDINEGRFGRVIVEKIHECGYFLPLMTPDALDSVWMRKEVSHALTLEKRIIPILIDDYVFDPDVLPTDLRALASYNGQPLNAKFYDACIEHLVTNFLK